MFLIRAIQMFILGSLLSLKKKYPTIYRRLFPTEPPRGHGEEEEKHLKHFLKTIVLRYLAILL